jgi:hypothetical protein
MAFERGWHVKGEPVDAELDLGLKPGDRLICKRGFLFNESLSGISAHVPDRVVVEKVFPRFIVVRAEFYSNGGKEYRECINKAALIAGDVQFKLIEEE